MGNQISHRSSDGTGKVILSDGTIHKYNEPLTVAELMLEYPQQVVVEFQPTTNGKRPNPLPADTKLDIDKVYVMVPKKRVKRCVGEVPSEEARRILLSANAAALNSKALLSAYTGFLPYIARICPAGKGLTDVGSKKESNLVEKSREMWKIGLINEGLLEEDGSRPSDFLSRQLSGKNSWKPSLDTITEKGVKAKIRHWLL